MASSGLSSTTCNVYGTRAALVSPRWRVKKQVQNTKRQPKYYSLKESANEWIRNSRIRITWLSSGWFIISWITGKLNFPSVMSSPRPLCCVYRNKRKENIFTEHSNISTLQAIRPQNAFWLESVHFSSNLLPHCCHVYSISTRLHQNKDTSSNKF
jgi:hypothetical protein